MATVFWERKGILSIDWLPEKTTIKSDYYISELEEFRTVIKRERHGKLSKGIYSNMIMRCPMSAIKQRTLFVAWDLNVFPPPYSSDLAPSDYWLFGEMKRPLRGKKFSNFKQLEWEKNHWVRGTPPKFFATGIDKLPGRWERCRKLKGEYIERFDDVFYLV